MSKTEKSQEITAILDNIDVRLEQLDHEIDLIRRIRESRRRETRRINSQTGASLERTVTQLADIARDHLRALELSSQNAERDREIANNDREVFRAEIRRIWEYLLREGGNGNASAS